MLKPQFTDDPGGCTRTAVSPYFRPAFTHSWLMRATVKARFRSQNPYGAPGDLSGNLARCAAAGVLWKHAGAAYPFPLRRSDGFFSSLMLAVV
jgi:hypothetical protein